MNHHPAAASQLQSAPFRCLAAAGRDLRNDVGGRSAAAISTACGGYPCGVSPVGSAGTGAALGHLRDVQPGDGICQQLLPGGLWPRGERTGRRHLLRAGDPAETGEHGFGGQPTGLECLGFRARANVGTSFETAQADGNVKAALLGVDYTFSNQAILGVALADTRARVDTPFNGGNFSADGTTVSPYLLYPLNAHWAVNAGFGIGRATLRSLDNTNGVTLTGQNKSDTTLANLGIEYNQISVTGPDRPRWRLDLSATSSPARRFQTARSFPEARPRLAASPWRRSRLQRRRLVPTPG